MITMKFAHEELNRYLKLMTGNEQFDIKLNMDASVFDFSQFPLSKNVCYNEKLDDAYLISVHGGKGSITATNTRAVLLGVYRFLRETGCVFLRTGEQGEIIPPVKADKLNVQLTQYAQNRHRGITIEGAVSLEHLTAMVDYAPKMVSTVTLYSFAQCMSSANAGTATRITCCLSLNRLTAKRFSVYLLAK